jgi:hypothetical protein
MYHRTAGNGWKGWSPPRHEMGPATPGDMVVKLICKYPSTIRNPMLFMDEPTQLLATVAKYRDTEVVYRERCPHGCFD